MNASLGGGGLTDTETWSIPVSVVLESWPTVGPFVGVDNFFLLCQMQTENCHLRFGGDSLNVEVFAAAVVTFDWIGL